MKIKFSIFLLSLLLIAGVSHSFAAPSSVNESSTPATIVPMTEEQAKVRAEEIKFRVNEIKAMDRSALSSAERKALRKELRDLKKEARATRGVYISVGALIIIILLLILIL